MSLLSRLFGGGQGPAAAKAKAEPEMHEGFAIFAEPIREGSRWRIAARIEKEVDGTAKVHNLIRADTVEDAETAHGLSLAKARQMIDEQGERIFG